MNLKNLLLRSLAYYRKTHIWVVLGTMVSTALLVGALVIGDSVHYSLNQIVVDRLGSTQFALMTSNRFFRAQTAEKLSEKLQVPTAPLLQTKGIAIAGGGKQRINNVQVFGVDKRFGVIGGVTGFYDNMSPDEAIINAQTAYRLQLKKGDEFLLRLENLDYIPRDVPLALDSETSIAQRFTVKSVVTEKEFGNFNLKADQIAPHTVFVSLDALGNEMDLDGRANVLLVAENPDRPISETTVNEAFQEVWALTDAGYELISLPGNKLTELRSQRIFIEPPVVRKAQVLFNNSQKIFSYFVNEIRLDERAAPYSFVSALGDMDMNEDEIIINEWLANDLDAKEGDLIKLTYYILGPSRSLVETTSVFRIAAVVPIEGIYADTSLMPNFPGLSDAENCRDWNPGIPIDFDNIRDKDEEYWDDYRGTPKAFLSLSAAQKMWHNRFGTMTAIRFREEDSDTIEETLTGAIDPASLGFSFRDVKTDGLLASSQSFSFAQLFLGLSFFIIIAALLLTGLLYAFSIEHRAEEIGLLSALGFTNTSILRLMVSEGIVLIIAGSILGAVCGVFYNQLVLLALKSVWQEIVGTSSLHIHMKLSTMCMGVMIGAVINVLTLWLVARHQLKQPIADLQRGITKLAPLQIRKPTLSLVTGVVCLTGVVLILVFTRAGRGSEAFALFFSAGSLFLMGGIACVNYLIVNKAGKLKTVSVNLISIGIRNTMRKRFRSLSIVGLLACGIFIVFTVGANRKSIVKDAEKRESGTGGFTLFVESVMPVLYDLQSKKGRDFYSLDTIGGDVDFVSIRVKEGDDASCLNLNRVSHPQLLGVNPKELSDRGSFSFAKISEEVPPENPWDVLDLSLSGDVIPGIADESVIVWGLGKSVGDTLTYVDESGAAFKVKLVGGLANSIFQGNIIISEKALLTKYPSLSGFRLFLVDAPFSEAEDITQKIIWALQDQGVEVTTTFERLARFSQVENTYLSIFLILGTFGLILGSVGIGIVIMRNVSERRGELAIFHSVGFQRKEIHLLLLSEHSALVVSGIVIGMVSSLLAMLPVLLQSGTGIPYMTIFFLLFIVVVNGGLWTYGAAYLSTKNDLLPSLRHE